MPDPITNNANLILPTVASDSGTWGGFLNANWTTVDQLFGQNFSTTINAADVTLTTTQFSFGAFIATGVLTGNRNLIVPISTNAATIACGGKFVVSNTCTGAFNLTVKTATTGTGVVVPQGFTADLFSDGNNVKYTMNGLPGYAAATAGNPNGVLAGTQGSINTNASIAYDYTNNNFYLCTTTGTAASAVWTLPKVAAPTSITYAVLLTGLQTPDIQVFTSGTSLTYTTVTKGGSLPLYLRIRMVGGGGGGGATTTNAGSNGGDTSFGSWTAIHGNGGAHAGGTPGAGGTGGSNGTGTQISRIAGQSGQCGWNAQSNSAPGAPGGDSALFGGGGASGTQNSTGGAATANTGGGGQGGGASSNNIGSGGGAGEYAEFIITSPAASYTYSVGGGGSGGSAGGNAGGNGAAGRIEVIGYWQ
jgi:hypothetical protein